MLLTELLDLAGNSFDYTLIIPEVPVIVQDSWEALRNNRNSLLSASDWTQLPDSNPPSGKEAWAVYRQALRDLPANTTDPDNPSWPIPPT
jgi:hypothetical protein